MRIEDIKIPDHSGTRPTPRTAKWWKRRFVRYNKIAAAGNVDLIFLGDSITQNWERNGRKVWNEYYAKRNGANFGINSDRTQHVLYRVENGNFDRVSAKLIVLMIGTNNTNPPRETADGVIAIVQRLRQKVPKSKVLMLGIFPRGSTADDRNRAANDAANAIFKTVADGNMIHYMDIGHVFTNEDGTISKKVMRDYVHLSPHGYRLWAQAIEDKVARLMGEK
jgi:lysophospholipase L1-like esterase